MVENKAIIGAKYILKLQSGDPFGPKTLRAAEVLDVKEGWVKYKLGPIFNDERMEEKRFLAIFRNAAEDLTCPHSREEATAQPALLPPVEPKRRGCFTLWFGHKQYGNPVL